MNLVLLKFYYGQQQHWGVFQATRRSLGPPTPIPLVSPTAQLFPIPDLFRGSAHFTYTNGSLQPPGKGKIKVSGVVAQPMPGDLGLRVGDGMENRRWWCNVREWKSGLVDSSPIHSVTQASLLCIANFFYLLSLLLTADRYSTVDTEVSTVRSVTQQ